MSLTAPTNSGYSGFWNAVGDRTTYTPTLAQSRAKRAKHISKWMRSTGTRDVIGALAALIGATAGGTATNQWRRIAHPGANQTVPLPTGIGDFGGNRVIEVVTAINRTTTAADIAELKKWFNASLLEAGITYPTMTGSGGGGKVSNGTVYF